MSDKSSHADDWDKVDSPASGQPAGGKTGGGKTAPGVKDAGARSKVSAVLSPGAKTGGPTGAPRPTPQARAPQPRPAAQPKQTQQPSPAPQPNPVPHVTPPVVAAQMPQGVSGPLSTPASATGKPAAPGRVVTKPDVSRRTRKARLRLTRVDPWSVMKTAFLFSIAFGVMLWVSVYVIWSVVESSGLLDSLNNVANTALGNPDGSSNFHLQDYLNSGRVLGYTALLSVLNIVITTALCTLFAFLYNLSATVLGGLEVTLAED